MARITRDRENLLLEATALVPRVMLRMMIRGEYCEVFAGFRGESLSIYFGASPVYHFNAACELRRAFVDDSLIKADEGRLISSVRQRTADQVMLASTKLSEQELRKFLLDLTSRLAELLEKLKDGSFEVVGEVPPGGDALGRLRTWLENWQGLKVADVANVN